jgi:hypothetical protein
MELRRSKEVGAFEVEGATEEDGTLDIKGSDEGDLEDEGTKEVEGILDVEAMDVGELVVGASVEKTGTFPTISFS